MNNQLKRKACNGSIEASLEDNCLFGKILFIKALNAFLQHHSTEACSAMG